MIRIQMFRHAALWCGFFLLAVETVGAQAREASNFIEIRIVSEESAVGEAVSIRYAKGGLPTVTVRRVDAYPADVSVAVDIAVQLAKRFPQGVPGGIVQFSPRTGRARPRSVDPVAERRGVGYLERLQRQSASKNGIVVIVDTARIRRD